MANTKTTGLTSLTGALSATDDVFFVVDVSDTTMAPSGTSKKMTRAELGIAVTAAHAASPPTGAFADLTATGNTILGDAATDTLNVGNGGLVKTAAGNTLINTTTDDGANKLQVNGSINMNTSSGNGPLFSVQKQGTQTVYLGDVTGSGIGGCYLYNAGALITTLRADVPSTIGIGLAVGGDVTSTTTINTGGYTVATLPAAGTAGRRAYVTDAVAPTFLGTLTGGGTVKTPVFDNGVAWVAG